MTLLKAGVPPAPVMFVSPPGDKVCDWKIIYVVCDPDLDSEYKLQFINEPLNSNLLIIKGNDDYVHLFEKVVKAPIFNILCVLAEA